MRSTCIKSCVTNCHVFNDYETFVFGIADKLVWVFVSICKFEESTTEEKFREKGFKIGLMR